MYISDNIGSPIPIFINESYGIKEFNNKEFVDAIYRFINDTLLPQLPYIDENSYDSEVPDIKPEDGNRFKMFSIEHLCCRWLKRVDIYVSRNCGGLASYVLSTLYDLDKRRDYEIVRDGIAYPSYELNGNEIEYMSITLSIPYRVVSPNDLFGVIRHEIKHGYDYMCSGFNSNIMNKDILYANDFLTIDQKDEDAPKTIPPYWDYDFDTLMACLLRMDVKDVMRAICSILYYLNSSEMTSRLNNHRASLIQMKKMHMKLMNSSTQNLYIKLRSFLNYLIKYIPDNIKMEFSEMYMSDFERIYSYEEEFSNKKSFRHSGNGNKSGFNNLMRFYIQKINSFLERCDNITSELFKEPMKNKLIEKIGTRE